MAWRFVDRGGIWIDTADCYSFWASDDGRGGASERVLAGASEVMAWAASQWRKGGASERLWQAGREVEMTPKTLPFVRAFRAKFGKPPTYNAGTYDAIFLYNEARAGKGGKLFGSVTNMDVHRLLAEKGAFERGALVPQVGLGRLRRQARLHDLLFELRVRQFDDDRAGRHLRAGAEDDALDAAGGRGRDPADVFRNEASGAAHRARHRTALDRVDPDRRALHFGSRGLEA